MVAPAPSASAQPCPEVEVIFARGTYEPPGVGGIGQEFVDAVRTQAAPRSVDVYAVNYPANTDFRTAIDGIRDAANRIQATAANCPDTEMVLGGFSQGAAVAGFVTNDAVPDGALDLDVPQPMAPEIADHVAAVALFGKPSNEFMNMIGFPPVTIGPLYKDKTIEQCVPNDPICADHGEGWAHNLYGSNGMVSDAAAFAVSRLKPLAAT
ncbi:cutinase family protein [Mycobacterium hubeiense]|uniref:cutinase family protein n=1 Tax=Mycobacterium hubeiense TaxID=1867256 RepID=UPI000C7EF046|nr:cutinase family protein [Mycobacterium sp. QGD 101]